MIDCIAGYHLNPWTCGIAKFNSILSRQLELPVVKFGSPELASFCHPLVSVKVAEFTDVDQRALGSWLSDRPVPYELFLHGFDGTELEKRLVKGAERIFSVNKEISAGVSPLRPDQQPVFCPGMLVKPQRFKRSELSVFTFGMAHKIRVPLYRRLHDLLDATGRSYSVYVSTALHENTNFDGSFVVRFEELQAIFNGQVYFMGYLSDTAVFNHLVDSTYLAAFFEKGLRANNTTVNAAMEYGCAVITNLDHHSPDGIAHMKNVIDINRCDRLPGTEEAQRIGRSAREIAQSDYGWDQLVAQLRPVVRT